MTPKFQPEADLSTVANSRMPQLKLCQMSDNGHLTIPKEVRDKWLMDPVRRYLAYYCALNGFCLLCMFCVFGSSFVSQDPDWRQRLKNFDSVFAPTTSTERPAPKAQDENVDLGGDQPTASRAAVVTPCEMPPALSAEEFQSKHATVDATITLNMGSNVTCYVVGAKLFVTSSTKVLLPGVHSENAKAIFMYAGGSWISESAKATRFIKQLF